MPAQRILLVEDDDHLRAILGRYLARRGHAVLDVADGAAARAALAHDRPDLLLLDINLPDETGWDVLRWLRTRAGARPRVIVLTAVAPPRSRIEMFEPDGILTKPFPIDALERLVEQTDGPSDD